MIAKAIAVGAGGIISFLAAMGSTAISEESHVSLGGAIGVGVFACGLVWYIASRLTKIEDHIGELKSKVEDLPCVNPGCPSPDPKSLLKKTK